MERALAAAVAHVPRSDLEAALPVIQPLAVSTSTKAEVKEHAGKALGMRFDRRSRSTSAWSPMS
ncbi:MAG: hypothetical protein H6519_04270 [Microthrixaceae bacterium]|nr:hypothetical protein [Microthrixaceae bacterium]